jgi:peptide/nickel transport system substrate-binding protein
VRRFCVVAICVLLIATFGPIAGAGATAKAASTASSDSCTQARVGGSITFGQLSIQPTLDAGTRNVSGSGGAGVFSALYDTLLRLNPKTNAIEPWLASGISSNSANTQYTIKLRPNVKFGNGDPFTADAVVAAQNRYLTKGNFTSYASYIKAITAVDPTTVRYDLTKPWTELPIQLTQVFGMIENPKVVDALGAGFATAVNAGAGAGPYEVTTFNPPSSVVLKAKTSYWGGPVCIQQITFTTPATPQQGLDSFNTGQYDMNLLRDPVQWKRWADSKPRVGTADNVLTVGASNLFINSASTSAHLNDVRVRQALQLATSVALVNQRGYQDTLIAHSELVPPELKVLKPTKAPTYSLAAAKKLLDQVKSETGWDGSMHLSCSTASSDQSVALAAVYNNAGFKIILDPLIAVTPWVTKVQVNRDYDIACGGLQAFNADYWNAFYARTFSDTNYSNFHDPRWLAAMDQLAAAPLGTSAYQTAMNNVQKVQNQLIPQIVYGSFYTATLMQKSIKGMIYTFGNIPLYGKAYTTKK